MAECLYARLRPAVRRTEKWSGGGETAGTEPERNDRRGTAGGKGADHSALEMPLVTSALFAERHRHGGEGRQGRPSAGEVKQESALVTAIRLLNAITEIMRLKSS